MSQVVANESIPEARRVPEGAFVARIDELLEKHQPNATVPWSGNAIPDWARNFSPRIIVDLGSGSGGFIHSALVRLGQWGCLNDLERVVLIEPDTSIDSGGEDSLRVRLEERVFSALKEGGKGGVQVNVVVAPIVLTEDVSNQQIYIEVLEPYRNVDLIIASHVTYYFGDGSGRELIAPLLDRYLSFAGRIWCVIRKWQCPIYIARAQTLLQLCAPDIKPFDYAEYFEREVLPSLCRGKVFAATDKDYLNSPEFKGRSEAAHLLMWREAPSQELITSPYSEAVAGLPRAEALFSERHFIIGRFHGTGI